MQTVELYHNEYGSGRPLVILHGLYGSCLNWRNMSARLGKYFKVYALDLRNHGNSPHSSNFNYEIMAADVRRFCLRENISNCIVIGHSMGGKVALQFTITYLELVRKLIVVDISPLTHMTDEHSGFLRALIDLDLTGFSLLKEVYEALMPKSPSLEVLQFILKNLARDDSKKFYWKINLEAIYQNLQKIQNSILLSQPVHTETLFMRGEYSNFITNEAFELIKKPIPSAKLKTIKNAAHLIHIDAPDDFMRTVLEFSCS